MIRTLKYDTHKKNPTRDKLVMDFYNTNKPKNKTMKNLDLKIKILVGFL